MLHIRSRPSRSQALVTEALNFTAVWLAGPIGIMLLLLAAFSQRSDIAVIGLLGLVLAAVGWFQPRREDEDYRLLFDSAPVAILEEDFTAVEARLDELRRVGVVDLRDYLGSRPEETTRLIGAIKINKTNPAAVRMLEAVSGEDVAGAFVEVDRTDAELDSFIEEFVAIWEGRREVALDLAGLTLEGHPFEAVLHWYVPADREGAPDVTRVIVTISDIAPRRAVEEQLAEAVEFNQRLLAFEQALAACSRALLLASGEDAMEVALESLRKVIGADRSYLAINFDDPELGLCFRVVNSVSSPEFAQDDWVGRAVPWSKYPMAREPLGEGRPFQHLAVEAPGAGWNRSLLAVPVFASGTWIGSVGFVDIARRTDWSQEAVRMLEVAAPMLGTFWEREVTRQRLQDLVQSKDRFIASVSHELRTPLAAVLGFAEELRSNADSFDPRELTEILELIADQSQDMTDMVEDLLVAARADIGMISIRAQEVYLRSQAEAALAALGPSGLDSVDVVGGPGRAWADPTRTRQIIRNLLTNAIRYGGSKIEVEAETENGATVLSVRDDGEGIPESQWERIFRPYERAHDRPSQPASIGLGLTVSRQLARLMGGDLVYRVDAEGSVFELTLPSGPGDGEADDGIDHERVPWQRPVLATEAPRDEEGPPEPRVPGPSQRSLGGPKFPSAGRPAEPRVPGPSQRSLGPEVGTTTPRRPLPPPGVATRADRQRV